MEQLTKLITGLSLKQQISILAVALMVGAGIWSFVHWKHEDDFRPLYTSMAPEDAATVVQKLRETGVEYRLSDTGGAVFVPSAKLGESRLALAAAGLPKTGRIGFELFDKSNFGATEFVEHINYKRALEGELERSVMSLAEVEQARVHLTLPKESVFLDQQQASKASVMVKLRPGAQISSQNVVAVTHLVASAVEGLTPEAVSVVDMDGSLLSRPRKAAATDGSEITSESLEVRAQLERSLVSKINETLEPLLGPNGFRAGASLEIDLTSGDQQEETLDPTRSVMLSSQKSEDVTERASVPGTALPGNPGTVVPGGIPGTASNLPTPPPTRPTGGGQASRRTESIQYQTSRVVRHTRIPQGVVRRMSLAVLVGQSVRWDGDGAARHRVLLPPAPETLKTIKDLVAAVTGFSAERGDQLIVETLPFESSLNSEPPKIPPARVSPPVTKDPPWLEFVNKHRNLLLPAALGLVVLLALLVVFMVRRKRKKHEVDVPGELSPPQVLAQLSPAASILSAGELAAADERALAEENHKELAERVRQAATRDPAATANVLRMWLQETRAEVSKV
jgi:flagellar M-ring protein FliF